MFFPDCPDLACPGKLYHVSCHWENTQIVIKWCFVKLFHKLATIYLTIHTFETGAQRSLSYPIWLLHIPKRVQMALKKNQVYGFLATISKTVKVNGAIDDHIW